MPSMSYQFLVYNCIQQVPETCLIKVHTPCNLMRTIDVVEKSGIENIQNYYVVVEENGEPLFLAYYQLLSVIPKHFNLSHRKVQKFALSLALRIVKPTLLIAGNLFRHDTLFYQYLKPNLDEQKTVDLYQQTLAHMVQYTNASGIFLKDVDENQATAIKEGNQYIEMENDISMEITLPECWTSFADYEKALKHKYLQRCRKTRKSFTDIRIVEFSLEDIEKYSTLMEALYLQVSQKQLVCMGILNDSFFVELKKSFGDDYKVFGYFQNDTLIAFSSAILHQQKYDMNYIGFDYHANQSLQLYFNILFHCLEMAIELKCTALILGRTALEAKAILGCKPDYRYSFYKLRNVVVHWFFTMVSSYFKEQQGEKWKERHPFKSTYYHISEV